MIIIEDIHFSFPGRNVFENFSITIPENQISILTGTNGVGKSTLLRIIIGNLQVSAGEVFFESLNSKLHKENYEVLYAQPRLYPLLTVRENLTLRKIELAQISSRFDELDILNELGLNTYLDVKAANLSKGNQMKLALVLTLLKKPQYLFLDEPTSNLDYETSMELSNILKKECEQHKTTILIASHDQKFIEDLSGNVIKILKK